MGSAKNTQCHEGAPHSTAAALNPAPVKVLAGVPLAKHVHGPLLLTDPTNLQPATHAEIDRVLGGAAMHKTVYILGGTSAISQTAEDTLRSAGYTVKRLAGDDRFGTALTIAQQFGTTSHAIVATGKNSPDALSAGPLGAVETRQLGGPSASNRAAYTPQWSSAGRSEPSSSYRPMSSVSEVNSSSAASCSLRRRSL